jgi:outer membrane receptor protein involved in Fe transport
MALAEFARETGTELLFDRKLVDGLVARPVSGRLSARDALSRLLSGTGIAYREASGSFVLFRPSAQPTRAAADDPPVPEILVIGRRSQNADIRRTENDIQPYKVATRREIENAHRSNIEEFTRARVPANAQNRTLAQDVVSGRRGNVRSAIDLRGLGRRSTLVLVDGRRLPSAIDFEIEFDQPDLNGVPLSAVERIETLTGTAGGIHGPGALGGVINVVLSRDYSGADLQVRSGISSRGDAKQLQVEGRIGLSPNDGRTGLMLLASHQISQPQLAGERDFDVRARRLQFANDPSQFVRLLTTGNAINVFSATGANLVLDPQFGSVPLGAPFTFLPLGFEGTPAEAVALLQQNAGKVDLQLPPDGNGRFRSLVSRATVTSGLVNLRHHLTDHLELFVDGLAYRNEGWFRRGDVTVLAPTFSIAPTNPFRQPVWIRYPLPGSSEITRAASDTARVTAGAIAKLPHGWSGSADYNLGFSRTRRRAGGPTVTDLYSGALGRGTPGSRGVVVPAPFGSYSQLLAAAALQQVRRESTSTSRNNFSEANVRAAGPLLQAKGGPVVLSLLGQQRIEKVPVSEDVRDFGDGFVFTQALPARKQAVSSAYAELRAPLLANDAAILSGLELQFAVRFDRASTTFRPEEALFDKQTGPVATVRSDGFNYTLGAKFYPLPRLMARASVATGELYPTIGQLTPREITLSFQGTPTQTSLDPKRGGQPVGGGAPVTIVDRGSSSIEPERARTISVGAVFDASGNGGPRISIDYSRIDKRREIIPFPLSIPALLAAEEAFPDRVMRGILTEADARRGFTAGPVTGLDLRSVNEGSTIAEAIDLEFDWAVPLAGGTEVRAYGSATWQPRFETRSGTGRPWVDTLGFINGPSAWRANAGAEWRKGPLAVDVNVQMFSRYRVTYAGDLATRNPQVLRYQGREFVPSQAYVDLSVRRRFQLGPGGGLINAVDLRFGVQNVFDKRPPTIANQFEVPYSTYGDARRRRFQLTLASEF